MGRAAQPAPPSPLVREGSGGGCAAPDVALDAGLLAAHAAGDESALVRLCACAADAAEARGEPDAACFFLTQAYVFALSAGSSQAGGLHARLLAYGREE
jgi:hypothetical protein